MQPVQSHKVHSQKNPGFGLMLCCHYLEILIIFEPRPHFHVSLNLKNSVADSETSPNLADGCIRHLVSIVLSLFIAKNEGMACLVPSALGPLVPTACLWELRLAQPRRRESYFSTEWPLAAGQVELTKKHFLHSSQG